jgi:hypothetical protein
MRYLHGGSEQRRTSVLRYRWYHGRTDRIRYEKACFCARPRTSSLGQNLGV